MVFHLSNAMPSAYLEEKYSASIRKRRYEFCPEEWGDTFGEEFYDFALQNGFYYIAPFENWKPDAGSSPVHSSGQASLPSNDKIKNDLENLRMKLRDTHGT